jgi:predicted small secreted protein
MHRVLVAALCLIACAGCNTISGIGKDLQAIGDALTNAADDAETGDTKPDTR